MTSVDKKKSEVNVNRKCQSLKSSALKKKKSNKLRSTKWLPGLQTDETFRHDQIQLRLWVDCSVE